MNDPYMRSWFRKHTACAVRGLLLHNRIIKFCCACHLEAATSVSVYVKGHLLNIIRADNDLHPSVLSLIGLVAYCVSASRM